jgi:hypothetical protein
MRKGRRTVRSAGLTLAVVFRLYPHQVPISCRTLCGGPPGTTDDPHARVSGFHRRSVRRRQRSRHIPEPEELIAKLGFYLRNDDAREAIARAAYRCTIREYRFRRGLHRAAGLIGGGIERIGWKHPLEAANQNR